MRSFGEEVDIRRCDNQPVGLWYIASWLRCGMSVLFGNLVLVVSWSIDISGTLRG